MSIEEYNEEEEYEQNEASESSEYDDNEYQDEHEEKKGSRKGARIVLIIAVLLLLGLNGFLFQQFFQHKKDIEEKQAAYELLEAEKAKVEAELADFKVRVEDLKKQAGVDKALLEELEAKLIGLEADLAAEQKKSATLQSYAKYKKDFFDLKGEYDRVIAERDSFKKASEAMAQQINNLNSVNQEQLDSLKELGEDIKKLEMQKALAEIRAVKVLGIQSYKKREGKEDKESTRASQVNKFNVEVNLAENKVAKKGPLSVYVACEFGGKVLDSKGTVPDTKFEYTAKTEVNWQSKEERPIVTIELGEEVELSKGPYTFKIYVDGKLKDTKVYELR
ncbi:MAG: hypothetical protein KDC92_02130 [Bacteroidetes bacterium]|nr:hypothetical protein [Bacteroidota bacterium]